MRKIVIILSIAVLLLQACKEECPECYTPPAPFVFELVDHTTGENLFTNGTFSASQIEVINTADDSPVEFEFLNANDLNLIQLSKIGWETETVNYAVRVSSEDIFNLYVDAAVMSANCCTYTRINEVRIENAAYDIDQGNGVYVIHVE